MALYDIEDLMLMEDFHHIEEKPNLLLEAFAGKMQNADKIESKLETIVKFINETNDFGSSDKGSVNSLKEVKELEILLKNAFGLKDCILNFYNIRVYSPTDSHSFTSPSKQVYFSAENISKLASSGKLGVEAIPSTMMVNVNIDTNLIKHCRLNAKETLALILHEMGRDSEISYTGLIGAIVSTVPDAINIATNPANVINTTIKAGKWALKSTDPGIKLVTGVNKGVNDAFLNVPGINTLIRSVRRISAELKTVRDFLFPLGKVFDMLVKLSGPVIAFLTKNSMMMVGMFSDWYTVYTSKKFADSFAAKYGYGAELMVALNKMTHHKNLLVDEVLFKVPFFGRFHFDVMQTIFGIIFASIGDDPKLITRARTQLDNLKKDLNDPNLNPRLKKELMANIAHYEKVYKSFLMPGTLSNDKKIFQVVANRIFDIFFGIGDIRDLIAPNIRA